MAQLPYAQWFADENENRVRRKELAIGFEYQLQRKEKLFDAYLGNINVPRMTEIGDPLGDW